MGIFLLPMAGKVIQPINSQSKTLAMAAEANPLPPNLIQNENKDITFQLPLKYGRVAADYGKFINPFTKKEAFHNGIDVAAPKGTEVYAAADGKVVTAITDYQKKYKGRGRHIVIQHENGFETFYSHLNEGLVQEGQKVTTGEIIARVGNTGKSTGPHLHFEIRKNGKSQNPEDFIKFDPLKKKK